jgi:hypothetical protein
MAVGTGGRLLIGPALGAAGATCTCWAGRPVLAGLAAAAASFTAANRAPSSEASTLPITSAAFSPPDKGPEPLAGDFAGMGLVIVAFPILELVLSTARGWRCGCCLLSQLVALRLKLLDGPVCLLDLSLVLRQNRWVNRWINRQRYLRLNHRGGHRRRC